MMNTIQMMLFEAMRENKMKMVMWITLMMIEMLMKLDMMIKSAMIML